LTQEEGGKVKWLAAFGTALTFAALVVALAVKEAPAQTSRDVYEACLPGKQEIAATKLPPTVDQARCPVRGRTIVDAGGVGTVLPEPGSGVYVEAYGVFGGQELEVLNRRDRTFAMRGIGSDSPLSSAGTITAQAVPDGCGDGAYKPNPANQGSRLYRDLPYRFNSGSTPSNVSVGAAETAIRKGNQDISQVINPCGVSDGVPRAMVWDGTTSAGTDVNADTSCGPLDQQSVIGFGDLPARYLAWTCTGTYLREGQDEVASTDIRINKRDYSWTAEVTSNCSGRYDIEATVAHERGHSYGMYHVDEGAHPYQTMSAASEGSCQTSERSLGLGDARGLNQKYP
jgi:hypothetical protein